MANWRYTVDIKDDWALVEDDQISIHEFICRIVPKFKALPEQIQDDMNIEALEMLIEDGHDVDAEDFDWAWEDVMDAADAHLVWIATLV